MNNPTRRDSLSRALVGFDSMFDQIERSLQTLFLQIIPHTIKSKLVRMNILFNLL